MYSLAVLSMATTIKLEEQDHWLAFVCPWVCARARVRKCVGEKERIEKKTVKHQNGENIKYTVITITDIIILLGICNHLPVPGYIRLLLFDVNLYIVEFVMCIGQDVLFVCIHAHTYMHTFVIRARYKFYARVCVCAMFKLEFGNFLRIRKCCIQNGWNLCHFNCK